MCDACLIDPAKTPMPSRQALFCGASVLVGPPMRTGGAARLMAVV